MDIKALAQRFESYIIDRRRYYHACPELSGEEVETTKQLKADLEAIGITEITMMKTCNGLTAMIRGGKPGKTIGLRSDIDGLKVDEETGLPFAARNGNMHACGHDNHISMLLGAAKILNEVKQELCGNVKLIFQPAEEIAMGARWMMAEGVMDDVDALYGAHIWGELDAPLVDVTPGNRMASCDIFEIKVEGVAAHASAPHLGVDAITAAASIIVNLQQYVARMNDPLNPLVITVGEIRGGKRFNILPDLVEMQGGVRTFSREKQEEHVIRQIAENTAEALGAKATVAYRYMTSPIINDDPMLNRIAKSAVVKLYGEEGVGHLHTLMGSEDFSVFTEGKPYFFAFIGSRNEKTGCTYTNHHAKYDVDESVLQRGAAVAAQFAVDYLAETAI